MLKENTFKCCRGEWLVYIYLFKKFFHTIFQILWKLCKMSDSSFK